MIPRPFSRSSFPQHILFALQMSKFTPILPYTDMRSQPSRFGGRLATVFINFGQLFHHGTRHMNIGANRKDDQLFHYFCSMA